MANPSKIFLLILSGLGLLLLSGLVFIPATKALAWEVVTGQVSTMVKRGDKVFLTILLDSPADNKVIPAAETQAKTNGSATSASIDNGSTNSIDLEIASDSLPLRLKPGDHIRIWENPDSPKKTWRISFGQGHDPTGVRSRLYRCGGRQGRGSRRGGGKGGHGGH